MMNFQSSIKKFNEVNDAATQQKENNEVIDLVDDILDYDNPLKDTFTADPEDIFIDDNLFDDFDQNYKKYIKMASDDILQGKNLDQNNVLFEELPTRQVRHQLIKLNARLELAANKIKKKKSTDKEIGKTKKKKKTNVSTAKWLKKFDFLDTREPPTIDYSNNADISDPQTIHHNNDVIITDLGTADYKSDNIDETNSEKT